MNIIWTGEYFYLSYVITNFEYGGLPVDLCFVSFIFTVWRRKTCGISRKGLQLAHLFFYPLLQGKKGPKNNHHQILPTVVIGKVCKKVVRIYVLTSHLKVFTLGISVNVLHFLNAAVFNFKPREEWGLGCTLHGSSWVFINTQHQGLRVAWKVNAFLSLDLA